MTKILSRFSTALLFGTFVAFAPLSASADGLTDRITAGDPVRLGYAESIPWAFTDENGKPTGFVNALTKLVLEEMGVKTVEPSVTEWAALIPGLQAKRYDLITGGMYILKSRCENIAFSDPIGLFGDAFIVPKGNPKGIHNYQDIIKTGAKLVTGAGFNTIEAAKKEGVPASQMMIVAGEVEILAALKAGRADAGINTHAGAKAQVDASGSDFEVTDPKALPLWTQNWVAIGFRKSDPDFLKAFNAALAKVIGSDAWMAAGAPHGYTEVQLPGADASTEYACANK